MEKGEWDALDSLLEKLGEECYRRSRANGFWESYDVDSPQATMEVAVKIGLVIGECSELMEAWREGNPWAPCNKTPTLTITNEEIADVIIRMLDLASFLRVNVGDAVRAKLEFNATRPYKHSKRF